MPSSSMTIFVVLTLFASAAAAKKGLMRREAKSDVLSPAATLENDGAASTSNRAKLNQMTKAALWKQAMNLGIPDDTLESADKATDGKHALIDLIEIYSSSLLEPEEPELADEYSACRFNSDCPTCDGTGRGVSGPDYNPGSDCSATGGYACSIWGLGNDGGLKYKNCCRQAWSPGSSYYRNRCCEGDYGSYTCNKWEGQTAATTTTTTVAAVAVTTTTTTVTVTTTTTTVATTQFIITGNCDPSTESSYDSCVVSPNYPSHYDSGSPSWYSTTTCEIQTPSSGSLTVVAFEVENNWDKLFAGDTQITGTSSTIPAGSTISWTADGSVTKKGWKICHSTSLLEESASEKTASSDGCEIPAGTNNPDEKPCGGEHLGKTHINEGEKCTPECSSGETTTDAEFDCVDGRLMTPAGQEATEEELTCHPIDR